MKIYSLLKLVIFFLILTSAAKAIAQDTIRYQLKVGDRLTYDVNEGGKKYKLQVTFNSVPTIKIDYSKLAFAWKKTGDVNGEGAVVFKPEDIQNLISGSANNIDFDNLSPSKSYTSNALWLSEAAYRSLAATREFKVKLPGDNEPINLKYEGRYNLNGRTYKGKPCIIIANKFMTNASIDDYMLAQNLPSNPLIIYLNLVNFRMELTSID
jgi:hypothetical protein